MASTAITKNAQTGRYSCQVQAQYDQRIPVSVLRGRITLGQYVFSIDEVDDLVTALHELQVIAGEQLAIAERRTVTPADIIVD